MRLIPRAVTIFFWLLVLSSVAVAVPETYQFRGQTFTPNSGLVQGKKVLYFDDPEVQKLVALTAAQLQWSSSGQTLYVYAPGRQTAWNNGSPQFSMNKEEGAAPGLFISSPKAMEPKALFYALGLKPFPDGAAVRLLPAVTDVSLDNTTSPPSVVLKFGAPIKYQSTQPEGGVYRVELPDVAWDLPDRQFRRSEMIFDVTGGDRPGSPLVLQAKVWPLWAVQVRAGLAGDLTFTPQPKLDGMSQDKAQIQGITVHAQGDARDTAITLDRPRAFFWSQTGTRLQLDLPLTLLPATVPTGWQRVGGEGYPVARLETEIRPGEGFEFQELNNPSTLVLHVAPAGHLKPYPLAGTANMVGYLVARGTVVIDPGHGGGDPGCHNRSLGVCEKDVTLDISLRLRDLLTSQGWTVVLTHSEDRDVTYANSPDMEELQARSDVANRINADCFVSIHCNASVSRGSSGSAIYWYKPEDYELAQCLDVLGPNVGFDEKGLIQNRFAVLRTTNMPAALVETAFLTNDAEGSMLADPKVRQRIAEQLGAGLNRYMQGRAKGDH